MTKKKAKNLKRSKAAKKAAKKRVRVSGKFVAREVANDIIEFSSNAGLTVEEFIQKNLRDIQFYIDEKSVTKNYRTDDLITLINNHIGKVETKGYDYKSNRQLFKDLQDFKRNLINRKGINVADFFWSVRIKIKGKTLIIDLSEMEELKKMKSNEIEKTEPKNITLIISDRKAKIKAKQKLLKSKKNGKANTKSKKHISARKSRRLS